MTRRAIEEQLTALARMLSYDLAVTATLDGVVPPYDDARRVREWAARRVTRAMCWTSRAVCGPRWNQKGRDRPRAIGFVEHPLTNPHAHLAVALPALVDATSFEVAFGAAWKRVAPGGSVLIEPYRDDGWLHYAAKEWVRRALPTDRALLDEGWFLFA